MANIEYLNQYRPTLICPHAECGTKATMSLVSVLDIERVLARRMQQVGVVYSCDSCHKPVYVEYRLTNGGNGSFNVILRDSETLVQKSQVPFELDHLDGDPLDDIQEALSCFSNGNYVAFSAMCRRFLQSLATKLGQDGNSKVEKQLKALKEQLGFEEEVLDILLTAMLTGHDAAHPNLPKVDATRANLLLALIRDIVDQLVNRPKRLEAAQNARQVAINSQKNSPPN